MNRRTFLGAAALGAGAGITPASEIRLPGPRAKIEAVAFDGLAIFDPRPIGAIAEATFPGRGAELMALWRTRQFEYSWLRTLTGNYLDFWHVTQDALEFACASLRLALTTKSRDRLTQGYLQLKPWPDVGAVLRQLRTAGARMAFLTNFSPRMLDVNIEAAALGEFFEARLSTDRVAAFKPDPRSYQMAVDHFVLPRSAIAFVAFGGWDAAGAARFGFPVYWSNRQAQPLEALGATVDLVAPDLGSLAEFVSAG